MAKTRAVAILGMVAVLFLFSSCGSRETFYLYTCNFTEGDCTIQLSSGKYVFDVPIEGRTRKYSDLKARTDFYNVTVKLITGGQEVQQEFLSFPGDDRIRSYSAYGGLTTRVNVKTDGEGKPYIEINPNWEMDFLDRDLRLVE